MRRTTLTIQANSLPGTSLPKSDETGRRVEQILLAQPEVVATARRTGRAEYDEHVQGAEAAAEVRRELGSNMILRENVQRRIVVSSNVANASSRFS